MAKKRSRTVQTCTGCNKTGHNKRRCPLVSKTQKKGKTHSSKKTSRSSSQIQSTESSSSIPQKHLPKQHYVPVKFGIPPQSEYVVDLSHSAQNDQPSIEAIHSFREKIATVTQRRTVDFAATVRASTQSQKSIQQTIPRNKKISTQSRRMSFRMPKVSIPPFRFPRYRFPSFRISFPKIPLPTFSSRRVAIGLGVIILCGILPLPVFTMYQHIREESDNVIAVSTDAFLSLQESTAAAMHADTQTAEQSLQDALSQFAQAENFVEKDHRILADVLSNLPFIGYHVSSRRAILSAGQQIALGNTYIIKGINDAKTTEDLPMTERLSIMTAHLQQALPQYEEAQRALVSVNPAILPKDQQQLYGQFLLLYSAFVDDMHDLTDLSRVVYDVFGGDDFQRFLILFQNNNEIRPTGGFIGSFAMLDTQKGRIKNITIPGGGSYDVQGQLDTYLIPPIPLQLVNGRWEFQDINWFFDFPTSARKAESFISRARGTTFDGTIAINATVIERLLRVLGPVQSSEYNMLLDADTVLPTLQSYVEDTHTDEKAPKKILSDILDQILVAMQDIKPEQMLSLLKELHEALTQKEIQVALKDAASNARLASFGWTGSVVQTAPRQDYLAVVATNLQGEKSDARMTQSIEHTANVQDDGSVIVQVDVHRTHAGDPNEAHYGASNITYMRIYVPQGAVLLDAGGFTYPPEDAFHVPESWYSEDTDLANIEKEVGVDRDTGTRITNEFGKTVFGNWMIVPAGESRDIWFTYRLPFSVVDTKQQSDTNIVTEFLRHQPDAVSRYSLLVQKQSGVESTIMSTVQYPSYWIPKWRSDDDVIFTSNSARMTSELQTDRVFGVAFETRT